MDNDILLSLFKDGINFFSFVICISDEGSVVKFYYGKYTNIIYKGYDGEFTVEFNSDMYVSPSAGWFFSWWGVRYDVWAPDEVTLAAAAMLAKKVLFAR